MLYLFSKKSRN